MLSENAQLTLDTILQKPTKGIPTGFLHFMEHAHIERLAGTPPGSYRKDPETVYLACQRAAGVTMIDQYLATNPLTMGDQGYEDKKREATTGAEEIVRDGMLINSPEAVVEHMEKFAFPLIDKQIAEFDKAAYTRKIQNLISNERALQEKFGPSILKVPYAMVAFPHFLYGTYGYAYYFMAYALYPEVMERYFSRRADICVMGNKATAQAFVEGGFPPLCRLDFDMADSRGTLVNIKTIDKMWLPHFARCIEPMLKTNVRMIWHCDGNLMQMVPRLLDVGLHGFQGFQYEDGMDYEKICKMTTRDGESLIIWAGVSVTRTLPMGKPDDVKKEMKWLVENGPRTGLFLGASSSVAPGVPWENIKTFVDGLQYYRTHGRN